jgi:cell division septal protein FtsQ
MRAPFLNIKDVLLFGVQSIDSNILKSKINDILSHDRFFVASGRNMFFYDKDLIIDSIKKDYPQVESVYIKRNLKRELEVTLNEYEAKYVWCRNSSDCFFMNDKGLVFRKIDPSQIVDKIVFVSSFEQEPLLSYVIPTYQMSQYIEMIEKSTMSSLPIERISIQEVNKGTAHTTLGNIIFNPDSGEIVKQLQNALVLVSDLKKNNPNIKFEYIDARFGNKIFYK